MIKSKIFILIRHWNPNCRNLTDLNVSHYNWQFQYPLKMTKFWLLRSFNWHFHWKWSKNSSNFTWSPSKMDQNPVDFIKNELKFIENNNHLLILTLKSESMLNRHPNLLESYFESMTIGFRMPNRQCFWHTLWKFIISFENRNSHIE